MCCLRFRVDVCMYVPAWVILCVNACLCTCLPSCESLRMCDFVCVRIYTWLCVRAYIYMARFCALFVCVRQSICGGGSLSLTILLKTGKVFSIQLSANKCYIKNITLTTLLKKTKPIDRRPFHWPHIQTRRRTLTDKTIQLLHTAKTYTFIKFFSSLQLNNSWPRMDAAEANLKCGLIVLSANHRLKDSLLF